MEAGCFTRCGYDATGARQSELEMAVGYKLNKINRPTASGQLRCDLVGGESPAGPSPCQCCTVLTVPSRGEQGRTMRGAAWEPQHASRLTHLPGDYFNPVEKRDRAREDESERKRWEVEEEEMAELYSLSHEWQNQNQLCNRGARAATKPHLPVTQRTQSVQPTRFAV
ncbi:hypothetical protein J6590_013120 [Homalodisca vitripennis]|nr:hypothetical protein J6590_013120 [Homalodisca vitripennis]